MLAAKTVGLFEINSIYEQQVMHYSVQTQNLLRVGMINMAPTDTSTMKLQRSEAGPVTKAMALILTMLLSSIKTHVVIKR